MSGEVWQELCDVSVFQVQSYVACLSVVLFNRKLQFEFDVLLF